LPIDYGLVQGVTYGSFTQLNAPGGVFMTDKVSKDSPVLYGYGDTLPVYYTMFNGILNAGGGGFSGGGGGPTRASGRGDFSDADVIQGRPPYAPKTDPTDSGPRRRRRGGTAPTDPQVLLRFGAKEKLLISGELDHGDELAGKAAVVLCPAGKGSVLLMTINPMWRMETAGSYQLLFNAAMNYKNLWPKK
jgi:hypothetical protein